MGFEVGDETPKAEAGLVLLHPFNQNQKAQNARWDLVGEKVGKVETPPQNFNLLRKYLVGKCFEKRGGKPPFRVNSMFARTDKGQTSK